MPVVGMVNDDHVAVVTFRNFYKVPGGRGLLFVKIVERIAVKKLRTVLTCSDYLKRFIVAQYGIQSAKVQRLYQGINDEGIEFQPLRLKALPDVKIVFIKHRHDIGRLSDLLTALELLKEFRFHFTIIGPPNSTRVSLEERTKNTRNIKLNFLGPALQSVVHQQLHVNDLLCIPSSIEALGLANVEGMAHGIQIVSTKVGGIPEVLDGGEAGWLCEPCDPVSLANAIRCCLTATPETRANISERAFAHFKANFRANTMLDNLLQILTTAIHEHHAR